MAARNTEAAFVLLISMVLLLAACGGSDEADSGTALNYTAAATTGEVESPQYDAEDDTGSISEQAGSDTLGSGGADGTVLETSTLGREIIYTADMTVAVADVAAASAEATRIIEEMGGYLFGQESTGAPEPHSVLTFKVLPGDFQHALASLGSVGEIRTQNISTDDVTERVVDLASRIDTAETSVARLKGFLDKAEDIEAIAALESQLLERETDLETMRGQLRTLQDRIDLATISLTLTEALSKPGLSLEVTGSPGHDDGISCPASGAISVEEGEPATVCFEIVNSGDTPLAGFELKDTVLEVELGDLIVVWGDPNGVLEPGQSMVLAYETTVERSLRTQARVSAVPVDQDGNRVEGREVASTSVMSITAEDPGGLPGFRDGLDASWNALQWIGGVVVLLAGAVLPFVIPLVLWAALVLWIVRRRPEKARAEAPTPPRDGERDGVEPQESEAAADAEG